MSRRILTLEQIVDIKSKYSSGFYTEKQLSEEYNCSVMTICLWLKPNPYEILERKKKKKDRYSVCVKCPICGVCMQTDTCDCQVKKRYYNDFDDLKSVINNFNKKR